MSHFEETTDKLVEIFTEIDTFIEALEASIDDIALVAEVGMIKDDQAAAINSNLQGAKLLLKQALEQMNLAGYELEENARLARMLGGN
jgi:hypothetical protein